MMNSKVFFALYSVVIFFLGGLVSFMIFNQPNPSDMVTKANGQKTASKLSLNALQLAHSDISSSAVGSTPNATSMQIATKTFNTQQFNEQQAKQLINSLPDTQLNQYVERFITSKDATLITDKRLFANRAIEELYKANDTQPLVGQVLLSDTPALPNQSINTTTLPKRQKLYAHLNTFGKVPLGANVFIKWVNRNTGEVLLFEKKIILPDATNNWVSYQPHDGWQTGSYDIRFYQFTSQLEPVAQLSYDVNQVVE